MGLCENNNPDDMVDKVGGTPPIGYRPKSICTENCLSVIYTTKKKSICFFIDFRFFFKDLSSELSDLSSELSDLSSELSDLSSEL